MEIVFSDYIFDFEIFKCRLHDVKSSAIGIGYVIFSELNSRRFKTTNLIDFILMVRSGADKDKMLDGINDLVRVGALLENKDIKEKPRRT